jgi:predicted PurR-regulated permease PerM
MTTKEGLDPARFESPTVYELVIRLCLLGLLVYFTAVVVGPFLTVALWSAVIAVALYPLFDWLAAQIGRPRIAAVLMTLLCLTAVIGPIAWLGLALIGGAENLVRGLDAEALSLPLPPEAVKSWPLVGEHVYRIWTDAVSDMKSVLLQVMPRLKPLGGKLLETSGTVIFGLVEFVAAIVIAGFLYVPGPRLARTLRSLLRRISGQRSEEMLKLAGSTIRNVSRGVVGVALVQSIFAGIGFVAAGVPAAGFYTLLSLVLGIIQIGPSILILPIIVWTWITMETGTALMFTVYMIPVSLIDNVLRPMVMARGLATPMPIILIGVLGGMLAYGISGLFLGPIVLSVAWALMVAWMQQAEVETHV